METSPLDIDRTCATLEGIAQQHPTATREYQAVELAAKALLWIYTEGHLPAFTAALPSFEADEPALTPEEELAIRRQVFEKHGVTPPKGL